MNLLIIAEELEGTIFVVVYYEVVLRVTTIMVVNMKRLPPGAGWLLGGIVGIAFMVLILFFEPNSLVPIGIVGGSACAIAIGFALEQEKKPLTAEQEKRARWLTTLLLVLLSVGALLGLFVWLRYL